MGYSGSPQFTVVQCDTWHASNITNWLVSPLDQQKGWVTFCFTVSIVDISYISSNKNQGYHAIKKKTFLYECPREAEMSKVKIFQRKKKVKHRKIALTFRKINIFRWDFF